MERWFVVHDVYFLLERIENEFDRFSHQLRERRIRWLFQNHRYSGDFPENQLREHQELEMR